MPCLLRNNSKLNRIWWTMTMAVAKYHHMHHIAAYSASKTTADDHKCIVLKMLNFSSYQSAQKKKSAICRV